MLRFPFFRRRKEVFVLPALERAFPDSYFNQYLGGKDRIYEIIAGVNEEDLDRLVSLSRKTYTEIPFVVRQVFPDGVRGPKIPVRMPFSSVSTGFSRKGSVRLSHPIFVAEYHPEFRSGLYAEIM